MVDKFVVGDYLMSLDKKDICVFWQICKQYPDSNGLVKLQICSMDDFHERNEYLLLLEKSYVKVNESTINILYGGKHGNHREKEPKGS